MEKTQSSSVSLWPAIKLDGAFCSTSYVSTIAKSAYKNRSEVKTSLQRSAADRLGNSEGDTLNQKEEGEDLVGLLSHLENHHLAAGGGGDRSQLDSACHFFSPPPFYQLLWIPSLPLRSCPSSPPFHRVFVLRFYVNQTTSCFLPSLKHSIVS